MSRQMALADARTTPGELLTAIGGGGIGGGGIGAGTPGRIVRLLRAMLGGGVVDLDALDGDEGVPPHPLESLDALAPALRAAGARLRLRTSGTTGDARAVVQPVGRLLDGVVVSESHRADVWGLAYDPYHLAGLLVVLQAACNGNALVDLTGVGREEALDRLRNHGVTHLSATPTFYRLLHPVAPPLAGVRAITFGGERLDGPTLARARGDFPGARVRNIYALTEAGTVLLSDGELFRIPDTLADRVRVEDDRLLIARSLIGERDGGDARGEDAWYDTGDRVERVGDRLRFVGRRTQLINVGGQAVDPLTVEAALMAHPSVRHAVVAARPSSVTGALLVARIVEREPVTDRELRQHLSATLARHAVPRLFERADEVEVSARCKSVR